MFRRTPGSPHIRAFLRMCGARLVVPLTLRGATSLPLPFEPGAPQLFSKVSNFEQIDPENCSSFGSIKTADVQEDLQKLDDEWNWDKSYNYDYFRVLPSVLHTGARY